MTTGSTPADRATALASRWQALQPRERCLVALAAATVLAALLWWVALAPAIGTLRQAAVQREALDAQWQQMARMQQQAEALKAAPKLPQDDALRALEASLKERFGSAAQLTVLAERATVTLKGVPGQALAQWLADARVNARSTPVEARLTRSASTPPAPRAGASASAAAAPSPSAQWDGTLTLSLPPR